MIPSDIRRAGLLLPFGAAVYLLNRYVEPVIGMRACQLLSAGLLLAVLAGYVVLAGREGDERERLLQLRADSAALYAVIGGLLAAAIFYPASEAVTGLWLVVGFAAAGRVVAATYQRYS